MLSRRRPLVVLVEPDINPITRRFGLPIVANYPPLAQVGLAGQIDGAECRIVDLRVPGERRLFLESLDGDPPDLIGISLTFTSNGDEAIGIAAARMLSFDSSRPMNRVHFLMTDPPYGGSAPRLVLRPPQRNPGHCEWVGPIHDV